MDTKEVLRGLMARCVLPSNFDGDYKDSIGAKSAMLCDLIEEVKYTQSRALARALAAEAARAGLGDGYETPRATSEAWRAFMEGGL